MRSTTKGNLLLLTAAIIWGCSLVAQKAGLEHLGPFWFTALRCLLGGLVMIPVVFFMEKKKLQDSGAADKAVDSQQKYEKKQTVKAALCCGTLVGILIMFQQFGLPYTTVGKAGFITALYILITPIIGIFLGKKSTKALWTGVVIGLAGMYMLCLYEGLQAITLGDVMMLGSAFFCSVHLHTIDHFVKKVDPVKLTCSQFIVAGIICMIPAVIFETISWEALIDCVLPLMYASVFSCAVGYTLQTVGQKSTSPNMACLLLSLETVFALFAGWIFFGEVLSGHEYIGCMLMFAAIMISQLPEKKNGDKNLVSSKIVVDK